MAFISIPSTFMRGGTSKALMFLAKDLPEKSGSVVFEQCRTARPLFEGRVWFSQKS